MPEIKLEGLSLAALGKLDPRLEALFQKHMQTVSNDCMNRPLENTARKVMLEFEIKPVPDPESGTIDYCTISIEARSKVPTYRTKAYQLAPSKAGFQFNSEVPENLKQPGLFAEDGDSGSHP